MAIRKELFNQRYKERLRKNSVVKKIEEKKRLIFLGLHKKLIKTQKRDLLCSFRPPAFT